METKAELREKIIKLEIELAQTRQMIVICAECHDIRDKQDKWHPIADFLAIKFKINFSHSICPKCAKKLYPEFYKK